MKHLAALAAVIAGFLLAVGANAQTNGAPFGGNVVNTCGTPNETYTAGIGYVFPGTIDTTGKLCVNAVVSANVVGTVSNASSGQATSATNLGTVSYNYGFNGTTWDQLQVDASKFLKVNCATGCSGGTASNAGSAVATSATNGQTLAFGYAFNGTTWDQIQDDVSKNLKVVVNAALPTGANTLGAVTQASGPWTQNLTQVAGAAIAQGHGTAATAIRVELPTDGTGLVTVAQATAASLNATVVNAAGSAIIGKVGIDQTTPGTTNLVQIGGTLPSGTNSIGTVVATQTTAASLNATVVNGGPAQGTAASTAVPSIISVNTGGLNTVPIACTSYAFYDASTSGLTQIVALSGSTVIRICGYSIHVGATATNVGLSYGTATNCGTGTTKVTPLFQIAANAGRIVQPGFYDGIAGAAANALCVNTSAANAVQVEVWYTQY